MSLIKKGLFIGNFRDAQDIHFLQRNGITHVLCSAAELFPVFPSKFVYKHIPANDIPSYNLGRHFDVAADFILEAIQSGGNILVHCAAGISRSVSFVLAYLIKHEGMKLANGHSFVKSKRFIINPNPGFMKQLREFEGLIERRLNQPQQAQTGQPGQQMQGDKGNINRMTATGSQFRLSPTKPGIFNTFSESPGKIVAELSPEYVQRTLPNSGDKRQLYHPVSVSPSPVTQNRGKQWGDRDQDQSLVPNFGQTSKLPAGGLLPISPALTSGGQLPQMPNPGIGQPRPDSQKIAMVGAKPQSLQVGQAGLSTQPAPAGQTPDNPRKSQTKLQEYMIKQQREQRENQPSYYKPAGQPSSQPAQDQPVQPAGRPLQRPPLKYNNNQDQYAGAAGGNRSKSTNQNNELFNRYMKLSVAGPTSQISKGIVSNIQEPRIAVFNQRTGAPQSQYLAGRQSAQVNQLRPNSTIGVVNVAKGVGSSNQNPSFVVQYTGNGNRNQPGGNYPSMTGYQNIKGSTSRTPFYY